MPSASAKATKVVEQPASGRLRDSGSASGRLRRGLAKAAGSVWAAADDKDDQASHLANQAVALGAKGSNVARHGVGKAAKAARRAMAGQAPKGIKARMRRRASSMLHRDRKGPGRTERAVDALGGQVSDLAGDQESRAAATAGRLAARSPGIAARTGRRGVKATRATVHGIRRGVQAGKSVARGTQTAAKAAARGVQATAKATVTAVHAVVHTIQVAIHAIGAAVAAGGAPILAVMAALLVVVGLLSSIIGALGLGGSKLQDYNTAMWRRTGELKADIARAGAICKEVTPALLAAQLDAESGFDEHATSPAGAQGIAQFMPATWANVGLDGDGDGVADVLNAHDAIWTQGNYMCRIVESVKAYKSSGAIQGDTVQLALAAYNAGLGAVCAAHGIPAYAETQAYVRRITEAIPAWETDLSNTQDSAGIVHLTVGSLKPALSVGTDGIVDTSGIDKAPGASYAPGQCTWWAAIRRAQIGRPVDPYMGNGGNWAATGRAKGYKVSTTPHPGDALSFAPGVLGADATYGHVAVVEAVDQNGDILISEANARGLYVVNTRTITAGQLKAAGTGVQFIQ